MSTATTDPPHWRWQQHWRCGTCGAWVPHGQVHLHATGHEPTCAPEQQKSDVARVAAALERIAAALERMGKE